MTSKTCAMPGISVTMVLQRQPVDDGGYDVVALAASAGGLKALSSVLGRLPEDFPAPVLVVQHRSGDLPDLLPVILGQATALRVKTAEEGEVPRAGVVYTAPPGRHIRVGTSGQMHVRLSERIRFVRPSADLLFETLAARHGPRSVGVVLTGMGDDGARGVRILRRAGGFVIAQDESTSEHFDMPLAAAEIGRVDVVLPLFRIPFALTALVMGRAAAMAWHGNPGPVGRELTAPRA
jgi:two-component system chemotaxis response regulator CheB